MDAQYHEVLGKDKWNMLSILMCKTEATYKLKIIVYSQKTVVCTKKIKTNFIQWCSII